jgi:hypothetical protein
MNVQTLRKAFASVSATALLLTTLIVPGMGVNSANAQAAWFQPYLDVASSLEMSIDAIANNPGDDMDRCETAELYVEAHDSAFGIGEDEVVAAMEDVQFSDTSGTCQVAAELMLDWGLMFGQGGTEENPSSTFGANDILNKNDQAVVAFRYDTVVIGNDVETSDHRFGDVDYNAYFGEAIQHLTATGAIVGEGGTAGSPSNTFGNAAPANKITTLVMAFRVTELTDTDGEDTGNGFPTLGMVAIADYVGGGTSTPVGGDLTVSRAHSFGDFSAPQSARRIKAMTIAVTTGDNAVTLNSLKAYRTGQSNRNDIDKVRVIDAGTGSVSSSTGMASNATGAYLTSDRSIGVDNSVDLIFNNLTIPANTTQNLLLVFSTNAAGIGNEISFEIRSEEDVMSSAQNVSLTQVIKSGVVRMTAYNATTGTFTAKGSSGEMDAGVAQIVAEWNIALNDPNDVNSWYNGGVLKNTGTGEVRDLGDFQILDNNNTVIPANFQITGDFISYVFQTPYEIEGGDSRNFKMRATANGGIEAGDTFIFKLDDNDDLDLNESGNTQFGNNIAGEGTVLRTYTVKISDFTVFKSPTSPSNTEVAPGEDDVVVGVWRITMNSGVRADGVKLRVSPDSTVTAANDAAYIAAFAALTDNMRLKVNGATVDSTEAYVALAGGTSDATLETNEYGLNFDNSINIEPMSGQTYAELSLVLNIRDAATVANLRFTLAAADFDSLEYASNGDAVPAGEITGVADGSTVAITIATITLTRNDGIENNKRVVAGATDRTFLGVLYRSGVSQLTEIDSLNVDVVGVPTETHSQFTNFAWYVGDERISDAEDLIRDSATTGHFQWSAVDRKVAKNSDEQLTLRGTIQSGVGNSSTLQFTFDVSDSTFSDDDGDNVANANGGVDLNSTVFAIVPFGTLNVTVSGDSPDPEYVVAMANDTVGFLALELNLNSRDDDAQVTDVHLGFAPPEAQTFSETTLTAGADPADAETITIGLCAVSFTTAAQTDADCGDNVANAQRGGGAAATAASLRTLINIRDANTLYTVGGAGSDVVLTARTAVAGNAAFTDGTGGDVTVANTTIGVAPTSAHTKSSTTYTVNGDPAANATSTFGTCVVTYTTAAQTDADCSDNVANAQRGGGNAAVAASLRNISNFHDNATTYTSGGAGNTLVLTANFAANGNAAFVNTLANDLAVVNTTVGVFAGYITTVDSRVKRVELWADGVLVSSRAPSNGIVDMDLGSSLGPVVLSDTNKKLQFKIFTNPITDDSQTGQVGRLEVISLEADSKSTSNTLAFISGVPNANGTQTVAGLETDEHKYVASFFDLTALSHGSNTILTNGENTLYRADVTPKGGDVVIARMAYTITGLRGGAALGAGLTGVTGVKMFVAGQEKAVTTTVVGNILYVTFVTPEVVSSKKTFEVRAQLSGFNGAQDSISVFMDFPLRNFTTGGLSYANALLSDSPVVWSDESGINQSTDSSELQWHAVENGLDDTATLPRTVL